MKCCCGHESSVHLGGVDLPAESLKAYALAHPGGDGGMCRAQVGAGRCECFNFCDCYKVTA